MIMFYLCNRFSSRFECLNTFVDRNSVENSFQAITPEETSILIAHSEDQRGNDKVFVITQRFLDANTHNVYSGESGKLSSAKGRTGNICSKF